MALFPAIQLKARDELDSVTGGARLPTFEDYDSLPYIRALVFECLRWHPVLPLGVAHRTIKNDVYRGMSIPRDTTVIPNIWSVPFILLVNLSKISDHFFLHTKGNPP